MLYFPHTEVIILKIFEAEGEFKVSVQQESWEASWICVNSWNDHGVKGQYSGDMFLSSLQVEHPVHRRLLLVTDGNGSHKETRCQVGQIPVLCV